jgi:hypothetical protein
MLGRDENCTMHILNSVHAKACSSADPVPFIIKHPGLEVLHAICEKLTATP